MPSVVPTPSNLTNTQILVLGVGTTLGIVVQALILIPPLRKVGFRWRWRFRAGEVAAASGSAQTGLGEERALIGWVLGYVVISQAGLLILSRVAVHHTGLTTFLNADLLFQVPYGILGVALLTALMPRMSRAAARQDRAGILADLSLGTRLSAVALLPISATLMVLGPALGTVIFGHGETTLADARHVGVLLALAAFGLLPFAMVMLQLRVFYAMKDARTPTLINVWMVAVKIALVLAAAVVLPDRHVVEALSVATSTSYVVGAVAGHFLLRRRFGDMRFGHVWSSLGRIAVSAAAGALVTWLVLSVLSAGLGTGRLGSLLSVVVGSIAGLAVTATVLWRMRLPEVREVLATVRA